jgi:hypothetical protein
MASDKELHRYGSLLYYISEDVKEVYRLLLLLEWLRVAGRGK